MSRKRKDRHQQPEKPVPLVAASDSSLQHLYERACALAEAGERMQAIRLLQTIEKTARELPFKALVQNDLAALAFLGGEHDAALKGFDQALAIDPNCEPARKNLAFLQSEEEESEPLPPDEAFVGGSVPIKVAILSFLFNWPTTGGGNVHTQELAIFLGRAGYDVKHFYVDYAGWGIGNVQEALPYPNERLHFAESEWTAPGIQACFRAAVERFDPDYVVVTDSWNFKPLLAEAVQAFPYVLRLQGMECLCPLNNVRLLPESGGRVRQCHLHQLATPQECADCVRDRGQWSGSLHQAERALSGVGTQAYYEKLLRVMNEALAVLVVNPIQEALLGPYARSVKVVTAGMDPDRFPVIADEVAHKPPLKILFAGMVSELMKGFEVIQRACALLWEKRQDFKLVVTDNSSGPVEPFAEYVGWQSQGDLPRFMREADICVVPTIAQEALGRTAVEAMAASRPVVASRLGGLPYTVVEGTTGLLCHPGKPEQLAQKIALLLDDPELRRRLGTAGRKRFEEHYAWPVIIERHYRPLFCAAKGKTFSHG